MHTVSAAFQTAIAQGSVRLCEIVDVLLASGTTHRFTNHDKDITWNAGGDIYLARLPSDYRAPIRYNTDGSFDSVEIMLGMIEGALRDRIKNNILEAAQITIRLIRWDATYAADEEIILFGSGVPDPTYNAKALRLRIISKIDSLNRLVPRDIYQASCNRYLFDDRCRLIRADYVYHGTATGGSSTTVIDTTAGTLYKVAFDAGDSGNPIEIGDALAGNDGTPGDGVCVNIVYLTSTTGTIWYVENTHQFVNDEVITGGGNTVTVNGSPATDTGLYVHGEIEMTSGDNSGESRPVLLMSGSVRTVVWPFVTAIAGGDDYDIYPGCDGRVAETCLATFNNKVNWRGFTAVPPIQEIMM